MPIKTVLVSKICAFIFTSGILKFLEVFLLNSLIFQSDSQLKDMEAEYEVKSVFILLPKASGEILLESSAWMCLKVRKCTLENC